MKVHTFDTATGLYAFQLDSAHTDFHRHPATEIVVAEEGSFVLDTEQGTRPNLQFAVIAANRTHRISSSCPLQVVMIEHRHRFLAEQLALHGIELTHGLYTSAKQADAAMVSMIVRHVTHVGIAAGYDPRVAAVIHHLQQHALPYHAMIGRLQQITHLSESRLSHLFKADTGLSLKKYLIWTKLKSTIQHHLTHHDSLFDSLVDSGFYDQPHFSRHFKAMLGVQPSRAYNSRTVQVLPPSPS